MPLTTRGDRVLEVGASAGGAVNLPFEDASDNCAGHCEEFGRDRIKTIYQSMWSMGQAFTMNPEPSSGRGFPTALRV